MLLFARKKNPTAWIFIYPLPCIQALQWLTARMLSVGGQPEHTTVLWLPIFSLSGAGYAVRSVGSSSTERNIIWRLTLL